MTNHIPPEKLLPQDMVDIFDHGPKDKPHDVPAILRMHATDAKHAMAVEPERYALEAKRLLPKLELVKPEEPIVDFGTAEDDGA